MKRDRVVKLIVGATAEPQQFLDLVKKHKDSTESFNITEFLQALPGKDHSIIWKALEGVTEECVQKIAEEGSEVTSDAPPTSEKQLQFLSMIGVVVEFVCAALGLEDVPCPTFIRAILQQLHELLLGCLDVVPDIQNKTSALLEAWWQGEGEGREEMVPNTILYLVARTLDDGAKVVDVKRVWEMRKSLMLLDFEDSLTLPFKTMLLTCTTRHIYLKAEEGRRFLSFLFGMHPKFVEDLHQTFKNQIPLAPKALLEVYAEVYFRAWRLASGPYLQQLEEHCLQDLMFCAVHAPRAGSRGLFHSLKIFLRYIHGKRTQTGVSKMLLRLYSPFLWRSLKVAHPHVRANAAFLLLDAFPLQDPDATREQTNDVLQKQFDAMMDLLVDQSVLVRVTAVTGVCRVLSLYFDLVPFPVMKEILGKLVKELAWDAAAIDVRVAVVQGLCVVLENRLSHALMRDLLPLLHPLLHDNSEKVRLAFLELLILVKGMKSLKFWRICSIDDLLARMEVDSAHVVKRIVALMVDAFKPSSSQMVQRCLSLLRLNVGATRRFYQLAAAHLPPGEVVHLILALQSALVQFIKEDQEGTSTATESGDDTHKRRGAGALPAVWRRKSPPPSDNEGILSSASAGAGDEEEEEEGLNVQDRATLCGLLEVAVVLWEEVEDRLKKKTHLKLRQRLVTRTEKNMRIFYDVFTDTNSQGALYLLASHLPALSVQFMVDASLSSLRSSVSSLFSRSSDYTHLLVALVSWKRADDLIGLVTEGLRPLLDSTSDGAILPEDCQPKRKTGRRGNKRRAAGGKATDHEASSRPQPVLALSMLSWMITHPVCMKELKENEKFWALRDMLQNSMGLLERHLSTSDHMQNCVNFDLLRQSLSLYVRMSMHRKSGEEEEEQGVWFVEEMKTLMDWCRRILVPILSEKISSSATSVQATASTRRSSRKRKANPSRPPIPHQASPPLARVEAEHVVNDVLSLFSDLILIGLARGLSMETELANLGSSIAGTECGLTLLSPLCKLLYQLCESSAHQELAGIVPGPGSLAPTSSLLSSVLSLLHRVSLNEPPATYNKAWYTVRQCVTAIVVASLRASSLSLTSHPLQTYSVFVRSTLEAQAQHIRSSTSLPTPTTGEDLPMFVGCLLKQVCKDKQSTRLFGAHLHDSLAEQTCDGEVSQPLLNHLASLHLLHVLSRGRLGGEEEFVKSIRCTLKLLNGLSDDHREKWSDLIEQTKQQVEAFQEKIYST